MRKRTTAQNVQEVSNFERITSETHTLPTGTSKTFRVWVPGSHEGRGGQRVGMNARRLYFFPSNTREYYILESRSYQTLYPPPA